MRAAPSNGRFLREVLVGLEADQGGLTTAYYSFGFAEDY